MRNKILWVITLVQKTLGPYYKYIVKGLCKIHFHSLLVTLCHFVVRHTTYFLAIIPIATPFPTVYVEISLYPLWIHPPFDNCPWRRLDNQPVELSEKYCRIGISSNLSLSSLSICSLFIICTSKTLQPFLTAFFICKDEICLTETLLGIHVIVILSFLSFKQVNIFQKQFKIS